MAPYVLLPKAIYTYLPKPNTKEVRNKSLRAYCEYVSCLCFVYYYVLLTVWNVFRYFVSMTLHNFIYVDLIRTHFSLKISLGWRDIFRDYSKGNWLCSTIKFELWLVFESFGAWAEIRSWIIDIQYIFLILNIEGSLISYLTSEIIQTKNTMKIYIQICM